MPAWKPLRQTLSNIAPGVALAVAVAMAALATTVLQGRLIGSVAIDSYVAAILLGTGLRTLWAPHQRFDAGICFAAKMLLEIGVALLGTAISIHMLQEMSALLVLGIAALVAIMVVCSYAIGRVVGLSSKLSIMVACGNSICGNSAIAAVAPIIDADPKDMAAAIAFTAIWGIPIVIALPLAAAWLGLAPARYGTFAGLTIYSVPQVLAATLPLGLIAVQIGTLTKLVRIVMLAPVVVAVSLIFRLRTGPPLRSHLLPPWFIVGFFALMALRSVGLVPAAAIPPVAEASNGLTLLAMAALGLSADAKLLVRAGGRVTAATVFSMLLLAALSFGLVYAGK